VTSGDSLGATVTFDSVANGQLSRTFWRAKESESGKAGLRQFHWGTSGGPAGRAERRVEKFFSKLLLKKRRGKP
jgi:hypothetical protein